MPVTVTLLLLAAIVGCGGGSRTAAPAPVTPTDAAAATADADADAAPPDSALAAFTLREEAMTAYDRADHAACAALFDRVAKATPFASRRVDALWGAASCLALGGDRDAAMLRMKEAVAAGLEQRAEVEADGDLASLHEHPAWSELLAYIDGNAEQRRARANPELRRLYEEDQGDRAHGFDTIDWSVVSVRDRERRARVDELVAAGDATSADDYFHAAMVYQHGETVAEIERARELALRAVELDPGHADARWLACAAEDRVLMYNQQPQRWGTQYTRGADDVWVLHEMADGVTDAERAEWNVPPLAAARRQAERLNGK